MGGFFAASDISGDYEEYIHLDNRDEKTQLNRMDSQEKGCEVYGV